MKGRQRGRAGGKSRPQGGRNPNYDGGNNNRMRGNAQQLMDKYLAMARDATSAGDRVLAESYYQHADHYYRVVNARLEQQGGRRPHQGNGQDNRTDRGNQPAAQPAAPISGQDEPAQQTSDTPAAPAPESATAPSQSEADIGLPPGLLGDVPGDAAPAKEDDAAADKPSRPRQPARRRRSRSDKPSASANAGE